ncbi:MAG: hypothetical protein A3J83_06670 [Elusimicrobia bacterium RIFOXYA2_FULL_40_6]|nr:MAG: hypothetical protein A3J83_06670 [Elusimicrobia bacterium RIFOXYA2_FULL_40_6]
MFKKSLLVLGAVFISSSFVFAGEVDLLVNKLVEKGVLDAGEGQTIMTETTEEMKKDIAKGKADTAPAWTQNISLKGDLRIRYQTDQAVNAANRDRMRLRLRIGAATRIVDNFNAGFGLATGGRKTAVLPAAYPASSQIDIVDGESRSTNYTFGDTLSKGGLMVDYAYLQYEPSSKYKILLGKFSNPLWQPTDLLWDTDLNPDGISLPLTFQAGNNLSLFVTPSYFVLDEIAASNDPGIFSVQPGFKLTLNENLSLKTAFVMYNTQFIKGGKLDNSAKTNTAGTVALRNEYNAMNPSIQFDILDLMGYSVSLFGDYVTNPSSNTANTGYCAGINFGAAKVANLGDWQVKALSRYLETDAWLDTFPDSDSYGGATNCQGYEAIFTYGLSANTSISIDYYSMDKITGKTATTPKTLTQVDLVMKF